MCVGGFGSFKKVLWIKKQQPKVVVPFKHVRVCRRYGKVSRAVLHRSSRVVVYILHPHEEPAYFAISSSLPRVDTEL